MGGRGRGAGVARAARTRRQSSTRKHNVSVCDPGSCYSWASIKDTVVQSDAERHTLIHIPKFIDMAVILRKSTPRPEDSMRATNGVSIV